jgi:hypothetical protein
MISYRQLLTEPEKYQPLSSHKSVFDKANSPDYTNIKLEPLFLSGPNKTLLARSLYRVSRNNGGSSPLDKFVKLIPIAQIEFCKRTDVNQYEMAEQQSTAIRDWAELLRCLNNDFMKFCYNLLKWNHFNPFRERTLVGPSDKRKSKKFTELLAADIPTIDVYADYNIEMRNSNHWLDNKIPAWREKIQKRNLDREGGGLRNGNPERASLEVFQRGFDMTTVDSLIDKWQSKDWFGI